MKRNKIFFIFGTLFIVGFLGLLIWLQTMNEDQKKLQNSYYINLYNGNNMDAGDFDNKFASISKSTQLSENSLLEFLIPVISLEKKSFRIPIYGMNNMRMYFNETMYHYGDRLLDEEKFSKSTTDSYENLKSELIKTTNFDCNDLNISNLSGNLNFIIDESMTVTNIDKRYWKSLVSLKPHIDSLIKSKEITNDSEITIYFCDGHSASKEIKPLIDTTTIIDTLIPEVSPGKPIEIIKPKEDKITGVKVFKVDQNSNTFKIKTNNRSLNIKDNVEIILSKNGTIVDKKTLGSSELKNSIFSISGNTYKHLTNKSSFEIEIMVRINGKKYNLGEFSIFCNK